MCETHRLVGYEGLDDEGLELAARLADELLLVAALGDPLPAGGQVGVDLDQTQLAPALDQLIGLDDETLARQPGIVIDELLPVGRSVDRGESASRRRRPSRQLAIDQVLARRLADRLRRHSPVVLLLSLTSREIASAMRKKEAVVINFCMLYSPCCCRQGIR